MRRAAPVALFIAVMLVMSVPVLHAGAHRELARLPLAPEPPSKRLNLTKILTLNGPFGTFLTYLKQTNLVQVFQRQAYRTEYGITILVPVDAAFAAVHPLVLTGLSRHHLKDLMLYHTLARRYDLAEFGALSRSNPVTTLAGRPYTVNVTCAGGAIRVLSRWADAKIVGSVSVAGPMAVYKLDRLLLPAALFPARPLVVEAPAPAPTRVEAARAPPVPQPHHVAPRQYGSAGKADTSSAACRPGAARHVTLAAAAVFGALITLVAL